MTLVPDRIVELTKKETAYYQKYVDRQHKSINLMIKFAPNKSQLDIIRWHIIH